MDRVGGDEADDGVIGGVVDADGHDPDRGMLERAEKLGDRRYGPFPDIEIKKGLDDCCQGPPLALRAHLPPSLFTATGTTSV